MIINFIERTKQRLKIKQCYLTIIIINCGNLITNNWKKPLDFVIKIKVYETEKNNNNKKYRYELII